MAAQPEIHNFTIVTDRNDVPKTKWDYNAGRIYTTLSDSEQHHLLNIQDGRQLPEIVTTLLFLEYCRFYLHIQNNLIHQAIYTDRQWAENWK